MDIKVQIIAMELAEAINNLAAAMQEPKPGVGSEADAKESGKRRTRRNKNEKIKDAAESDPADEPTEETTEEENEATEKDEAMFDDDEPAVTREEVQIKLKEIAGAGKTAEVKSLLTSYNVKKFSELPEDKLAEILKKAEKI